MGKEYGRNEADEGMKCILVQNNENEGLFYN
jgi:hypothetical protein